MLNTKYRSALLVVLAVVAVSRIEAGEDGALVAMDDVADHDVSNRVAASVTETDESIECTGEKFIPTDEWQVIKPGQCVPPGLVGPHLKASCVLASTAHRGLSEALTIPTDVPAALHHRHANWR